MHCAIVQWRWYVDSSSAPSMGGWTLPISHCFHPSFNDLKFLAHPHSAISRYSPATSILELCSISGSEVMCSSPRKSPLWHPQPSCTPSIARNRFLAGSDNLGSNLFWRCAYSTTFTEAGHKSLLLSALLDLPGRPFLYGSHSLLRHLPMLSSSGSYTIGDIRSREGNSTWSSSGLCKVIMLTDT